jgi:hypothetical protein
LGNLKDKRAVSTLIDLVEDKLFIAPKDFTPDQELKLKQEAMAALGKIGGSVALLKLRDLLNSEDPQERMMAARGYSGASGRVATADLLIALKGETDPSLKSQIIFALGNVGSGLDVKTKQMIVTALINEMENNTRRKTSCSQRFGENSTQDCNRALDEATEALADHTSAGS